MSDDSADMDVGQTEELYECPPISSEPFQISEASLVRSLKLGIFLGMLLRPGAPKIS